MPVYPRAYVGLPITADFWNSGMENFTVKGSDTARVNATLLADPDLSGIALPVGQHYIRVSHFYKLATSVLNNSVVQYRTAWAFSGAATGTRSGDGPSSSSGESAASVNSRSKKIAGAITTAQNYGALETFNHLLQEEGILNVTTAGNLDIQWCQGVTTAGNALTLSANSYVMWMQIG